MFYVVFCIALSVFYYLNERFSRLIALLRKKELVFLLSITVILLFLFEGVSSSLGKIAFYECIFILNEKRDNKQCLFDTPRRVTVNNKRLISKRKKSDLQKPWHY